MSTFKLISGVVSGLVIRQDEHDFVFNETDKATGAVAATGLAIGGLAGAATGALLSSNDTVDQVDYFLCKIGEHEVRGRFGKVSFTDGDAVQAAALQKNNHFNAYAVVRPNDRSVWMHPHCGRGSVAYKRHTQKILAFCALGVPALLVGAFMIYAMLQSANPFPIWFWFLSFVLITFGSISFFVASRFAQFAKLSDEIFSVLRWPEPESVDLPQRLRDASKSLTIEQRRQYHFYARWVFKY
jgi:hypothetical protein